MERWAVSTAQPTITPSASSSTVIQGSKIPRPSCSLSNVGCSSGGQPKSSPSTASARLNTHATSSSSSFSSLGSVHRHPSSPSLLLQASRTGGVKSSLHKSTSRLHLTHNNKGESSLIRSDLISAHWKEYRHTFAPIVSIFSFFFFFFLIQRIHLLWGFHFLVVS